MPPIPGPGADVMRLLTGASLVDLLGVGELAVDDIGVNSGDDDGCDDPLEGCRLEGNRLSVAGLREYDGVPMYVVGLADVHHKDEGPEATVVGP